MGDIIMKTWIDPNTNLEWAFDMDLLFTWEESQNCPIGYRLPTVKELCSVLDYSKHNPSVIDDCPFGWNDSWTSEPYINTSTRVYWSVNCVTGAVQPKDRFNKKDTLYVRNV